MEIFKPSLGKLIGPLILIATSFIPSFLIRSFVFEILAWPFGPLMKPFRYQDKSFLTPTGTIIVGFIWASVLYFIICLIASRFRKS
jgi:hypothetical protein